MDSHSHSLFPSYFLLLLLLSLLLSVAVSRVSTDDSDGLFIRQVAPEGEGDDMLNAENQFALFKAKFGKAYSSVEEHDYRFSVFKANLDLAKKHQALDPSAVHGVTVFSDLTPEEFHRDYLGLEPFQLPDDAQEAPTLPTDDLPEDFDWRDHGAVTSVKNQRRCRSSWAFSTIGALEGAHFLATGNLVSLSEQQLVDCDHECDPQLCQVCDRGCRGGLMTNAFEYILKAGGVEAEQNYPYIGSDRGVCKFNQSKIVASVANFSVIPIDEDQIAANLVKHGPLAVGFNGIFMQTYMGGVSCPYICFRNRLNHGALLVGYGSAAYSPIRFRYKPYWIIKNSWGQHWGADGYYKICKGYNMCGVDFWASTVVAVTNSTATAGR